MKNTSAVVEARARLCVCLFLCACVCVIHFRCVCVCVCSYMYTCLVPLFVLLKVCCESEVSDPEAQHTERAVPKASEAELRTWVEMRGLQETSRAHTPTAILGFIPT